MIFDTHAHYDCEQFDMDRDELLQSFPDNGIDYVVNVGVSVKSLNTTMELAEKYHFIYAALGIHPDNVGELNCEVMLNLEKLIKHNKVIAVGEIGLDYYWNKEPKAIQKIWFIRQIELAKKYNLPIIVHSRDAAKDTLDIIKDNKANIVGGVIHCFSYSKELVSEYLELGLYLGIGGSLTYKNNKKTKNVVFETPLDRIVLETDCPYLSPVPKRNERNSTLNLVHVAEEIALIKGISIEEVFRVTKANAIKMYGMSI
jgi:hydrolase, TatD family